VGVVAKKNGNVCVLKVEGALSDAAVKQFRKGVEQAFATDGRDFVVDFADATGIDSAGLEALTWLKRECDERLGLMRLCNLPETTRKILELTRLDRQLEQYQVEDETWTSLL
jgi:anti-anti-sigma factor